ncbi:MAG TPA: ATP-binding protein [Thermomicrobiales bacterium]|jgi:DNA replication protein DnaC
MEAPVGHPNFGRLFPCECTVKRREERLVDELWQLSNLDALGDLTFDNFDSSVDGLREAYDEAREYARTLHGWIFFHGSCGVGKTHLAVAIAQYAMDRAKLGVYFSVVPDLLDQLRATFDPANGVAYDDRFNQIRNCQLLVLDDLGTENTTPWAREKLYQILNHRYNEHRPTVITSNQPFERIEERILSRLSDTRLTRYLWIDAEDYRRQRRANAEAPAQRR